ncbi:MAG: J domain-containing protein [Candidatus Micrarchaeales archaeon]|nr:J domain-containing protein [Candidatus Micrarchaeales archaeon]
MKLLGNIGTGIRVLREKNREKSIQELLNATDKIEEHIATAMGSLTRKTGEKESLELYYKTLEIKRTSDQKIIRSAYVRLMKQHHPDVSKEEASEELAKRINEAYRALSEKKLDRSVEEMLVGGEISPAIRIEMANGLLKAYTKRRDEDFEAMRGKIANETDINMIDVFVREFTDWKRRYDWVARDFFKDLYKAETQLKRLEKRNVSLYKGETDQTRKTLLEQNAVKLESARRIYEQLRVGTESVASWVKETIEPEEKQVTKEMEDFVAYIYAG